MTTRVPTLCAACAHLRAGEGSVCAAFPGGIPKSIYLFGGDHRQPRPGDHGVTFELRDGSAAEAALADWAYVNEPEEAK